MAESRQQGLIDDRICARLWAGHWADQGYATAAIRERLMAKGLDADDVEDALTRLMHEADEATRARTAAQHWTRRTQRPTFRPRRGAPAQPESLPLGERRRLGRYLAQRGFEAELIEHILAERAGGTSSDE